MHLDILEEDRFRTCAGGLVMMAGRAAEAARLGREGVARSHLEACRIYLEALTEGVESALEQLDATPAKE